MKRKVEIILLFLLAVGAASAVWFYAGPSTGDDTFIYMRYVGNWLAGEGFVFNPGEASHGVTGALWAFSMALLTLVSGNTVEVWKLAGAIAFGLSAAMMFFALSRLGVGAARSAVCTLGGLAVPNTFRWAASGMENGLTYLLVVTLTLSAVFVSRRRNPSLAVIVGISIGVSYFARPELAVLAGLLMISLPWIAATPRQVKIAWILAVSIAALLGVSEIMAFGSLIPQTAKAKALALQQRDLVYSLTAVTRLLASSAMAAVAILVLNRQRDRRLQNLKAVFMASSLLVGAYLVWAGHLVSTRYATALAGPLVCLAMVLAATEGSGGGWRLGLPPYFLVVLQLIMATAQLVYFFPATRVNEGQEIGTFALDVRGKTDENSRIALSEVGAFGFYSGRYIVDLVGLTDRQTLMWLEEGNPSAGTDLESLLRFRRATHYVATSDYPDPIKGETIDFLPIAEAVIRRSNFSRGLIEPEIWRLYKLTPKHPKLASGGGGSLRP